METVQAIVPAAGEGKRLGGRVLKPFVELGGRPLLSYCLDVFEQSPLIDSVIVVIHPSMLASCRALVRKYRYDKIDAVVEGGASRTESVARGLAALDDKTTHVVIHDGVRPFLSLALLESVVRAGTAGGAAVAAMPVKPTIKRVDPAAMTVAETLDRADLWEAQTPQVFRRDIILMSYERRQGAAASDDAALVEKTGVKVKVVPGDYYNLKITTPEDMVIARELVRRRRERSPT